jgi:exodeoxyribonuclease V alpha subunit
MHGGVKVYRGAPSAARNYLEIDRSRADDYYLAEGTGIARRFAAALDAPAVELASLSGDGYEGWVAGLDPETGEPRGRVRTDGQAVRFVEVTVNGPKSWSLAAELHPDVAAVYEAAQDRAASEVIGWLARHATTRVGPRGAQVAVPVERLEAVTVRHYTSRAGDPHRHLHLQVNARVFAAGKWRGLDTVAFRDSIQAINGIGHAAVVCDPDFRAALAAHGYTLSEDGEVVQLAPFVGAFSKRAAQIATLLDRYEAGWRVDHPGREPGPGLRCTWDARAWAVDRPDKIVPRTGAELRQRWLGELAELGYRDRDKPVQLTLPLSGQLDRDAAVAEVLARLGAVRSAWNAADVRGEVAQLIARADLLADAAVRLELAEDLTARAVELCVPLREQPTPEHVRALTSRHVLDVEADLAARLGARGAPQGTSAKVSLDDQPGLDAGQRAAVTALAGDARLVVVDGAAGAGKTTTLAAAREALAAHGHRLLVVTPTLKAAQAATVEVGTRAGSAAWLAWQHGWRWDQTGAWTRTPTDPMPPARLRTGDLLLVDEAGMLDQDTARALVAIADEAGARVALVGDRHQLPAVGRGGVFDLAHRWVDPDAHVHLDTVHRFVRTVDGSTVPDAGYAQLSLAMRAGEDPGAVFDALHACGQITVHASEVGRRDALAEQVAATRLGGVTTSVVVDTREHAAAVNAAVRDRLVAAGAVHDHRVAVTGDGQRIGAGDAVVTRRNDPTLGVANRETWMVTRVHRDGRLTVNDRDRGGRELPAEYVRAFVELGYATTGYGAQGNTTDQAYFVVTDTTTAAAAYVAMTRGRRSNTAHLVAEHLDDAREQWITAFSREWADLGPTAARDAAARAAAGYFPASRPDDPARLADVLDELRQAWAEQLVAHRQLQQLRQRLGGVQERAAWSVHCQQVLGPLEADRDAARIAAEQAEKAAAGCAEALTARAGQHAAWLRDAWDAQLAGADHAARVLVAGSGPLGVHRGRMRDAQRHLDSWASRWAPAFGDGDLDIRTLRRWPVGYPSIVPRIAEALYQHAHRLAAADHPDQAVRLNTAWQARERYDATAAAYHQARRHLEDVSHRPVDDTSAADLIPELTDEVAAAQHRVAATDQRVATLSLDPAISREPDPAALLHGARAAWYADRVADHQQRALAPAATARSTRHEPYPTPQIDHGPSIGR